MYTHLPSGGMWRSFVCVFPNCLNRLRLKIHSNCVALKEISFVQYYALLNNKANVRDTFAWYNTFMFVLYLLAWYFWNYFISNLDKVSLHPSFQWLLWHQSMSQYFPLLHHCVRQSINSNNISFKSLAPLSLPHQTMLMSSFSTQKNSPMRGLSLKWTKTVCNNALDLKDHFCPSTTLQMKIVYIVKVNHMYLPTYPVSMQNYGFGPTVIWVSTHVKKKI